jgi:hypothetical protein
MTIGGVKKLGKNLDCVFVGLGVGTSSIAILLAQRLIARFSGVQPDWKGG